jgi:hypothetical protein
MVALRISVVLDGSGLYVEANGFGTVAAASTCGCVDCGVFADRCGVSGGVDVLWPGVVEAGAPERDVC